MIREHKQLMLPEPVQAAVTELTGLMRQCCPTATFAVHRGTEDPEETFITATVDVEDPDEVLTPVLDRLLTLQLDEGIPVYVVPVHTPKRTAQTRRSLTVQEARRDAGALPPTRGGRPSRAG